MPPLRGSISFHLLPTLLGSHAIAFRVGLKLWSRLPAPARENRACPGTADSGAQFIVEQSLSARHIFQPWRGRLPRRAASIGSRGHYRKGLLSSGVERSDAPIKNVMSELPETAWSEIMHRGPSTRPQSPFLFASAGSGFLGLAENDNQKTKGTLLRVPLGLM